MPTFNNGICIGCIVDVLIALLYYTLYFSRHCFPAQLILIKQKFVFQDGYVSLAKVEYPSCFFSVHNVRRRHPNYSGFGLVSLKAQQPNVSSKLQPTGKASQSSDKILHWLSTVTFPDVRHTAGSDPVHPVI